MTRPIRDKDPQLYRLITIRTEGARLWMKPSKRVNKTISGIIARYSELLGIEIYAFNFLSNHYHLAVRAPRENIDEFEENVNREIARRLNWINQREGKFWHRRYDDQAILNVDDLLEAFLYITTNPVRHGLVKDPSEWPGFSSYEQSITEATYKYSFNHYSEEENKVTTHKLKLSILPQFKELKKKKRIEKIKELIEERIRRIVQEGKANGEGFLTKEFIRNQDPNSLPKVVSRSKRPHLYSKFVETIKEYKRHLRDKRDRFIEASARYRLGDTDVIFPEFTFKPPRHRLPRFGAFQLLPKDYFKNAASLQQDKCI